MSQENGAPNSADDLSPEEQKKAVALILGFCALNQACRLYDLNNAVVTKVLEEMMSNIKALSGDGGSPVYLTTASHSYFINRQLVRLDYSEYRKAQGLKDIWGKLKITEVIFPGDLTMDRLEAFAGKFVEALKTPARASELTRRPWGGVVARLVLGGSDDEEEHTEEEEVELAVRVFGGLLVLVSETITQFNQDSWNTLVRLKRTLQVLVDKLEHHVPLLLALTRADIFRDKLSTHLTNTAVMALVVGRKLRMNRNNLVGLATAAMFHDMSKVGLNDRTMTSLEDPQKVPQQERDKVGLHWMNAMHQMIRTGGLREETLPRMVVAYESQLEFSSGEIYPEALTREHKLSLYSRIISLCDQLDTLTWSRPGKAAVTPHEAMLTVLERCKKTHDPGLLKVFMETIGLFPTGSVVRLSTNEIAVVTSQDRGGDAENPIVQVIVDRQGKPTKSKELRLAQDDAVTILAPEDATSLGINTLACFTRRSRQRKAAPE